MIQAVGMVLALLAIAGCADPRWNVPIELPPAAFDHPFPGVTEVHTETLAQLQQSCAKSIDLKRGDYVYACSIHHPGASLICLQWYPSLREVTENMLLALIRVEVANCNGWHDAPRQATAVRQ